MNTEDIIKNLLRYKREEFTCNFLEETINYFKNLNIRQVLKIEESEESLTGVRLHCMYNTYRYYLLPERKKGKTYRELNLTKNQLFNLSNQIEGDKNNDFVICDKIKTLKKKKYYLTISEDPLQEMEDFLIDETIFLTLIGVESLYFLEHQNLENYCSERIVSNSSIIFKSLEEFREKLLKLDWKVRNRILINGGMVYQFLGTVYTQDVDLFFLSENKKEQVYVKNYFKNIKRMDFSVVTKKDKTYFYNYHFNELPKIVGSENMYEILINPRFHFHFMGIKCISIQNVSMRKISRSHPFTFIDMILLKRVNGIDYIDETCIKNLSVRKAHSTGGNKIIVINNKMLNIFYQTAIKYMKEWWGIDLTTKYLKEHFKRCTEYDNLERNETIGKNKITKKIIQLNREIPAKYIKRYSKDKKYILDIGSSSLTGFRKNYLKNSVENIWSIEPTPRDVEMTKNLNDIKFKFMIGRGDEKIELKKKFDVITLIFTIQFISEMKKLLDNLVSLSANNTKVIITFVDGDKVFNQMKKNKKIEIRHEKEVYWGVYRYNEGISKESKLMFYAKYLKDIRRGSEEKLVFRGNLVSLFEKNNFSVVRDSSFLDECDKDKLGPVQRRILSFHRILVLKYEGT